jgi:DNA (cytosine-5)-methyltransferase 1
MLKERKLKNKVREIMTDHVDRNFSFIDIFAGCGGLSLGLLQSGWKGIFALEHDKNAFQTLHDNLIVENCDYKFDWPKWLPKTPLCVAQTVKEYRKELAELVGNVDMIVGGPPCQGFSSAGRRNPNDPRNMLVQSYIDFVQLINPPIVLIENVRGITVDFKKTNELNEKINYAKWIIESLSLNYKVFTKMIDMSLFCVPQKRHRFFIIGIRKDINIITNTNPFDLLERNRNAFIYNKKLFSTPISAKNAISDLEIGRNGKTKSQNFNNFENILYKAPITSYQKLMNKGMSGVLSNMRLARHRKDIEERFKNIIDICHSDGRLNISLSAELKASFGLKKNAIRVLDPDSPAPTITSMPDDLIHYSEPRTLTVRENARLQSFPDWFTFKGKYTSGGNRRRKEVPRFTQVANAVPPLAAEAMGLTLKQLLYSFSDHYLRSYANFQKEYDVLED